MNREMNTEIVYLRRFIKETESKLKDAKVRLDLVEKQCHHAWGELKRITVARTEFRNGPVVTRGSDFWYQPVPYTVNDPAWERTCNICGKTETTQKTEEVVTKKPVF